MLTSDQFLKSLLFEQQLKERAMLSSSPKNKRKAQKPKKVKFKFSKRWLQRMAELEKDCNVSAGGSRVIPTQIIIWKTCYHPFVIGGVVNTPIKCTVPAYGPYPVGKGYEAYVVPRPDGTTVVAESITGGLVGPTLEAVCADVKRAKISVIRKQMIAAKREVARATPVTPEQFWGAGR